MTSDTGQKLESLTRLQLDQYRAVEASVSHWLQVNKDRIDVDSLQQINRQLNEIKKTESELSVVRKMYSEPGDRLPSHLQPLVGETIEIVRRLLPQIGEMEQRAAKARTSLAPEVHAGVQAMKMKSAYAKGVS